MRVSHINQTISAVPANDTIAGHLGLEVGFSLLSLVRRSYFLQNDKEILVDYLLAP